MTADSSSNFDPTPGQGASLTLLGEVIALLAQEQINTMMPGTVVAYRGAEGTGDDRRPAVVDVRPDFLYRREINVEGDALDGEEPLERSTGWQARGSLPELVTVPVAYPGPDGARSWGPIKAGATGWLVFAQRSIDGWINSGGPLDPALDYQWHHLSDAIWIPGARHGGNAENDDGAFHVGSADGAAGITITDAEPAAREISLTTQGPTTTIDAATNVKLGASAVQGIARLGDSTSADATMATWIAQAQVVLAGAAALLALPVPVPPTDFGVISSASSKSLSE